MHFYDSKTAEPRHFVPLKADPSRTRPTRVEDAKKAGWYPSVTTIQKIIDKPALTVWLQRQPLIHYFESLDKRADGSFLTPSSHANAAQFAQAVIAASTDAKRDSTADRGKEIHRSLEQFFKGEKLAIPEDKAYACSVIDILRDQHGIDMASMKITVECEQYFASPIGYGGCIDLKIYDGDTLIAIVDFKSKEFSDNTKRLHYEENCEQLAAYRAGLAYLSTDGVRCINIYASRDVPGLVRSHEWDEDDLKWALQAFMGAFQVWCARKKWSPAA